MCRSLRRTQAAGAYTKWAWRSLCSDGLVHFSRCSNGMLVFHESHGNRGHPQKMIFWFTNLNGWCHKWKFLLTRECQGKRHMLQDRSFLWDVGFAQGFERFFDGELGETLKAWTGFFYFLKGFFLLNLLSNWLQLNFLNLIWLDLTSFLSFFFGDVLNFFHQGLYRAQGYLLNMRIITAAVWGPIIVGAHQENGMGKKIEFQASNLKTT